MRRSSWLSLPLVWALCVPLVGSRPAYADPLATSRVLFDALPLSHGARARVLANGVAQIVRGDRKAVEYRVLPVPSNVGNVFGPTSIDPKALAFALDREPARPFAPGVVLVVFASGAAPAVDLQQPDSRAPAVSRRTPALPEKIRALTNDATANRELAAIGTDRVERLFRRLDRGTVAAMRMRAQSTRLQRLLPIENAYRLHVARASVRDAVRRLSALSSVLYASPDWSVTAANVPTIAIPARARTDAANAILPATSTSGTGLPTNYALQSSAQSMLDAPGVDAAAAYDEIQRTFGVLPGAGEIITDISIGDIVPQDVYDPCYDSRNGPTVRTIGDTHYIDWPSFPLIPAYVVDATGAASNQTTCGIDPLLSEVGLDFTTMAPLPHALQRPGAVGKGLTDLLGIAPGASYRLVVPQATNATESGIASAFLAAASQSPRPDVITASLGFGFDAFGFPNRYLEDSPIIEAAIASIVASDNIVVCVSAGDGLRTFTNAAFGPRGGSAPTEIASSTHPATTLADVSFSTATSYDPDSGSIDVGGTTLNDIFVEQPQYAAVKANQTFAQTRYDGITSFASGFGGRVDVSAPSDNILAVSHTLGGGYGAVDVGLSGGTSASAPEVAAVSAVALQVAKLTNRPFVSVAALRAFLQQTARVVPRPAQSNSQLQVGPQVDLVTVVETLLRNAGRTIVSTVSRVAVAQRRDLALFDAAFLTATDRRAIDLVGPVDVSGVGTGRNAYAWITLAPDWEGLPAGTAFALTPTANPRITLARTRSARLLPADILSAVGQPLVAPRDRTVALTYTARLPKVGSQAVQTLTVPISLTFSRADPTSQAVLAPKVAPVVTGSTLDVTYDLSTARGVASPQLEISEPGRINPAVGHIYHPRYSRALVGLRGSVSVPVSALGGDGLYGVGIRFGTDASGEPLYSDFAYTHVARVPLPHPAAPLLSVGGSIPQHFSESSFAAPIAVSWDVSNIAGASGAAIEVSAAGPSPLGSFQSFNNDNGSERDRNNVDFGSVKFIPVAGVRGTQSFTPQQLGLIPTLYHAIRVVPTAGSTVVGEASDISTLTEDGVVPSGGGSLYGGWAINPNGDDGLITSTIFPQPLGTYPGSIDAFDQRTSKLTAGAVFFHTTEFFAGAGIFGNDVGVYGLADSVFGFTYEYDVLSPVTSFQFEPPFGYYGPPASAPNGITFAPNPSSDTTAVLAYTLTSSGYTAKVYAADVLTSSNGPLFDITPPTSPSTLFATAFGGDASLDRAVVAGVTGTGQCGVPTVETVDLANGTIAVLPPVGAGYPSRLGVDQSAHEAAVTTLCDTTVGLYDLVHKTTARATLPGFGSGFYVAADPLRHVFLVEQTLSPDLFTNNNSLSSIYTLDERGNVLRQLEAFDLANVFLPYDEGLQVDARANRGFTYGYLTNQLQSFTY